MNARDELQKVIFGYFGPTLKINAYKTPEQQDRELAEAILAAGYRKPRTITTEEEVEALPQGARLFSPGTLDFWIVNDLSAHGGVKVYGTGGGYTYLRDFIRQQAPLEVMHEPEA